MPAPAQIWCNLGPYSQNFLRSLRLLLFSMHVHALEVQLSMMDMDMRGYCFSSWRHQMETFSALLAFCAGIHRPPVNSPHKGQWHGALTFSLICAWTRRWANNGDAGDMRHHRAQYDVIVMWQPETWSVDFPYKGSAGGKRHYFHNHAENTCISRISVKRDILLTPRILADQDFKDCRNHVQV